MTRTAILGTIYNPFMIRYWLENLKLWQHKVDSVYISLERSHCKEIEDYLDKEIEKFPKVKLIKGTNGGFPHNVEKQIRETKEDLILLLHDDTYIYNPEILDKYFAIAEEGKAVTPLFSCYSPAEKIEEVIKRKYPFMPWEVDGYPSCSFVPYFLFCSRENFLKTEIDLGCSERKKGTYLKEVDYALEEEWGGDTGFWQSLQFLYHNIEVIPIKTNSTFNTPHHLEPIKEFNKMVNEGLDWFHLQNVARTIPLWFWTEEEWYQGLVDRKNHKVKSLEIFKDNPAVIEDMALKIAWLKEFMAVDSYNGIKDFFNYVSEELEYIIDFMKIDREKIKKYTEVIRRFT